MKQRLDKIMAVAGLSLLGYYLGLSPLRLPILRLLTQVLPPINNRNLPLFYTGLLGLAAAAPLGYLAYTRFVQKWLFNKHRKPYLIGILSLLILPLLVAACFRIQAVKIVSDAESTAPTDINIQFNHYISFWYNEGSGISYRKSVRLLMDNDKLKEIGSAVQQIKLKSVIIDNNPFSKDVMFIRYGAHGKRYIKILDYNNGYFHEDIGSQKYAVYEGPVLENIMKKLTNDIKNIKQYNQASMIHSSWISERDGGKKPLSQQEYQVLVSSINNDNIISPDSYTTEYFNKLIREGVSRGNQDVYGFYLTNEPSSAKKLENFMIYSRKSGVLWFEEEYYKADLSPLISQTP